MGCDIHFYVERRVDGRWVSADTWTPNKYYKPGEDDGERPFEVAYENRFYRGRNYDLFAMLADVRNGRGFGGVKTGEGFIPICAPRGLPDDVSDEVRAERAAWDCDGHSDSWLTVAELNAYDWQQTTQHQGIVDALNYFIWQRDGKPRSWAGFVDGPAVRHITNAEMDAAVREAHFTNGLYTRVTWCEPYAASAPEFLEVTLPRLRALGSPEDVRIVFWFDN